MQRFEDSIAWQKARLMTAEIYKVTSLPPFVRDFGLSSQIQRSSVSVMANIAEGCELFGDNQFHHALSIAKGSCAEVRSHLYVAVDVGHLNQEDFKRLLQLNVEVTQLVGALRRSVDQRRQGSTDGQH
jgi:four helix bundle protein